MDNEIKKDSIKLTDNDYNSLREEKSNIQPKVSIIDERNDFDDLTNYMTIIEDFDLEFMFRQKYYPWEDSMSLNTGKPEDKTKTKLDGKEEKKHQAKPQRTFKRRTAKVKSAKDLVSIPAASSFASIPMGRPPSMMIQNYVVNTLANTSTLTASPNTGTGKIIDPKGPSIDEIPNGKPYPSLYRKPMIPPTRPTSTREQVVKLSNNYSQYPYLVAVRGYYKNEFGRPGLNDRGMYDDALFFVLPDKMYSFNFNTDSGGYGMSTFKGLNDGHPTLKPGVWEYRIGMHNSDKNPHEALIQHGNFTVYRDGFTGAGKTRERREVTGRFGINLHRGGVGSVSSAGCQTVPPSQWKEFFYGLVKVHLPKGQSIKYFLVKG